MKLLQFFWPILSPFVNFAHRRSFKQLQETSKVLCEMGNGPFNAWDKTDPNFPKDPMLEKTFRMRDGGFATIKGTHEDRMVGTVRGSSFFPGASHWMWFRNGNFLTSGNHPTDLIIP